MKRTAIGLVVLVCAGIAVVVFGSGDGARCGELRLTSERWERTSAQGDPGEPTSRQRLAERIAACDVLKGWSRDRVRDALGEPTMTAEGDWGYVTGVDRLGDGTFLDVRFSPDARVLDAEHDAR